MEQETNGTEWNTSGKKKERLRVTLDLVAYDENGNVFYKAPQEWPAIDRRGLHAIQRAQLEASNRLLDVADKVLAGEIEKSGK